MKNKQHNVNAVIKYLIIIIVDSDGRSTSHHLRSI